MTREGRVEDTLSWNQKWTWYNCATVHCHFV